MAAADHPPWEDRFRDLARAQGWSYEIEVHPDGGIPRAVRPFADFHQVLSLHTGGPHGNSISGGLVIPALDQTRQDLFGGSYDPRTDHPQCYRCHRVELPQLSALDAAFTDLAAKISLLTTPGAITPFLAPNDSHHPSGLEGLSWIALTRLAYGEEAAFFQIQRALARLRRWSVGNMVEATVLKLLGSKARERDFERLEAAKERLATITSVVDPQRFQVPDPSMTAESPPPETASRDGDVIAAHKCCSRHRQQVEESALCGCFHCLATFPPGAIDEWVDQDDSGVGQTAMCPQCGIDSVIGANAGFPLTREFLAGMQRHWFGE